MKTKIIIPVVSLMLLFALAASSFAGNVATKNGPQNATIRYAVNLVFNAPDMPWFSHYAIKIYNEKHQLAAPAQVIVPGKRQYVFYERGPADGVRIAIIEKLLIHGQVEPWYTLICEPAIQKGPFNVGETYRFDLYPKVVGAKE